MHSLISWTLKLRNRYFLAADLLVFLVMPAVALVLRTDGDNLAKYSNSLLIATVVFLVIKLAVFYRGGMYRRYWRYASIDDLMHITFLGLLALCIQTLLFFLVLQPVGWIAADFPRSIPVIEGLLSLIAVGGIRFTVRLAERLKPRYSGNGVESRVLVAGAGWAGVTIVREMQRNPQMGMTPVAFLDDDPHKRGMRIHNVPVLGTCADIARVSKETATRELIIAMPTASGKAIREIIRVSQQAGVHARTIPGVYELLGGTISVKQVRDIRIEDLLRREPVETDTETVGALVRGKRVLVTGGGGSIGSELCRQVLRYEPATLIVMGHGENSVFEVHHELLRLSRHLGGSSGKPPIYSVIGDIRFPERVRAIFEEYTPDVVFHAAAHKHVPLMELNPEEAITNNVLGTHYMLDCSLSMGVEHFVMISSDKAVNPTGIMGASKRVAELLVHQAAQRSGKPYVAVRFGNVLGSRGSVVLTFQKQIADGGPITVTHPDMTRYFMTIPEAVQLVMQAAALGRGGEVFMLDMGEPIRIVDLARDLVKLSGLQLERDIDIVYTGVRPGEKLYEEMFLHAEDYRRTKHEKVYIAGNASTFVPQGLDTAITRLETAAYRHDKNAIFSGLRELVPEFEPIQHKYVAAVELAEPLNGRMHREAVEGVSPPPTKHRAREAALDAYQHVRSAGNLRREDADA